MNSKKIAIPVVLVLGLGISIYLWSSLGSADSGDTSVMGQMQTFVCPACKQEFQMTVEQAIAERRAKEGDIHCPKCGAGGTVKQDVKVNFGGPTLDSNDRPVEQVDEDPPKVPGGGMQPIGG